MEIIRAGKGLLPSHKHGVRSTLLPQGPQAKTRTRPALALLLAWSLCEQQQKFAAAEALYRPGPGNAARTTLPPLTTLPGSWRFQSGKERRGALQWIDRALQQAGKIPELLDTRAGHSAEARRREAGPAGPGVRTPGGTNLASCTIIAPRLRPPKQSQRCAQQPGQGPAKLKFNAAAACHPLSNGKVMMNSCRAWAEKVRPRKKCAPGRYPRRAMLNAKTARNQTHEENKRRW